ncbi:MAG: hypothetical protein ACXVBG_21805, partial [Isosphaeraceae bacterium]
DELGRRAARRRLGRARRAGGLGGDRRLSTLKNPQGFPARDAPIGNDVGAVRRLPEPVNWGSWVHYGQSSSHQGDGILPAMR